MPKSGKATRAASEREERERNIKLSHAHAAIDEHESAPHAPPSATDAASDAPSVSSARPSTPSRPNFGLRLACGRMRRPGCDGLCAVVLRDVGAEVPATVDVRSDAAHDAAVLRLLRLPARLDIVPRGNVQCADYIGANASRDAASKFICCGMILPRPGGRKPF